MSTDDDTKAQAALLRGLEAQWAADHASAASAMAGPSLEMHERYMADIRSCFPRVFPDGTVEVKSTLMHEAVAELWERLRALVDTLPRCTHAVCRDTSEPAHKRKIEDCGARAFYDENDGPEYYCAEHGTGVEATWAPALRAALALLGDER